MFTVFGFSTSTFSCTDRPLWTTCKLQFARELAGSAATGGSASGLRMCRGYVRRMEQRIKMSEGTNSAFSNGLPRENKKSGAGAESLSAIRPFWLAFRRTGGTTERAPRTVKSFVALSVRDKSSGSSPATIAHNSRHSNARARILPKLIRLLTICDDQDYWELTPTQSRCIGSRVIIWRTIGIRGIHQAKPAQPADVPTQGRGHRQ